MGRVASTLRTAAPAFSDSGLLIDPTTDRWADWGLLGAPDPDRVTTVDKQRNFGEFILRAFPSFQFSRFSELLIDLLQQVADGELTRLIVCCPPRAGKSALVSRLFPAYWVSRHPQLFCAIASYSAELAYAHSREARHYYRSSGHALSKDSAAVGNWLTPQRGGCIAAGVRGPFTGKGYNLGIIDDPYKGPEDAKSALQRERPEELQHLQLRSGRLWCNYRKNTSRGETKPRPLRLLPCDDWAEAWNLLEQFKAQPLPPMRPGYGAEDLGLYMRRRRHWQDLRQQYEAEGEKLVLYSARHGYAHRAHLICELPPKVAAAAMGHSVETHLAAYSKWCGDDVVDDAFERAAARLGR